MRARPTRRSPTTTTPGRTRPATPGRGSARCSARPGRRAAGRDRAARSQRSDGPARPGRHRVTTPRRARGASSIGAPARWRLASPWSSSRRLRRRSTCTATATPRATTSRCTCARPEPVRRQHRPGHRRQPLPRPELGRRHAADLPVGLPAAAVARSSTSWGLDYDRLKLVEVAALCVWLVLVHGIVRRRAGRIVALALTAVFATAPVYLLHTDQLLTEFPHMARGGRRDLVARPDHDPAPHDDGADRRPHRARAADGGGLQHPAREHRARRRGGGRRARRRGRRTVVVDPVGAPRHTPADVRRRRRPRAVHAAGDADPRQRQLEALHPDAAVHRLPRPADHPARPRQPPARGPDPARPGGCGGRC